MIKSIWWVGIFLLALEPLASLASRLGSSDEEFVWTDDNFHSMRRRANLLDHLSEESYQIVHISTQHFERIRLDAQRKVHTLNYDIIRSGKASVSSQSPRQTQDIPSLEHPVFSSFATSVFGKDIKVSLKKNLNLFGPNYSEEFQNWGSDGQLKSRNSISSQQLVNQSHCYYHGSVDSTDADNNPFPNFVALDACFHGFRGLIKAYEDSFIIEPAHLHLEATQLRSHLQRLQGHQNIIKEKTSLHVVIRAKDLQEQNDREYSCGVTHQHEEAYFEAKARGFHHGLLHERNEQTSSHDHDSVWGHAHRLSLLDPLLNDVDVAPSPDPLDFRRTDPSRHFQIQEAGLTGQKYVQLLVVNDYPRFYDLGSNTQSDAASLVNIVDGYYVNAAFSPPIEVILTSQVVFTNDPWSDADIQLGTCSACSGNEVSVDSLLSEFHSWRTTPGNTDAHDNGQLFSGHDFQSSVIGYANVGSMCYSPYSGGIDETNSFAAFNAATIAHEMGHNFGCRHDGSDNTCPISGFIMNSAVSSSSPPTTFSTCSQTYLTDYMTLSVTCLDDIPSYVWGNAVCGNGFVEEDEQCDCGQADCSTTGNPCCDGALCRYIDPAVCSETDPCCENCQFIARDTDTVCRAAVDTCDVAEYCTGSQGTCGEDLFYASGTSCTLTSFGDGQCYDGYCTNHAQQCDLMGDTFSGGPYTNCDTNAQLSFNDNNFCSTLWCTSASGDGSNCNSFTLSGQTQLTPDGVPCPVETSTGASCSTCQCLNNQCVQSENLNTGFVWTPGEWEDCNSCDETMSRISWCSLRSSNDYSQENSYDEKFCTPSAKPTNISCCRAAGCPPCSYAQYSDTIDFFGYQISRTTLGLYCGGAAAAMILTVMFCLQAVTRGVDEWMDVQKRLRRKENYEIKEEDAVQAKAEAVAVTAPQTAVDNSSANLKAMQQRAHQVGGGAPGHRRGGDAHGNASMVTGSTQFI